MESMFYHTPLSQGDMIWSYIHCVHSFELHGQYNLSYKNHEKYERCAHFHLNFCHFNPHELKLILRAMFCILKGTIIIFVISKNLLIYSYQRERDALLYYNIPSTIQLI